MKDLTHRLTLAAAMALVAGTAFAADPVFGIWKTKPDDNGNFGHINVAACGNKICGTLVKAFDSSSKEVKSDNVGQNDT